MALTEKRISNGASLVNEKHRNMQWKNLSSTSIPCSIKSSCTSHSLTSVWKEVKTRVTWTQQNRKMHIKELGLLVSKLAQKTFFKAEQIKPFDIQMDNVVALTYFLKTEGKRNLQMVCLSKHILELL